MKGLSVPVFAVCFATIASADPVTSMPVPMPTYAKSWVDDVLPPGALRPAAIGPHNCLSSYPEEAKADHIEGITSLDFRIADDGSVNTVSVRKSSGNKALDNAAVACVKTWRYQPAVSDNKPIEIAWRNDVKWAINPHTGLPVVPPPPPGSVLPLPVPTQDLVSHPLPPPPPPPPPGSPSMPATLGAPHVCLQDYPPDAVIEQEQGTTLLQFIIGEDGRVKNIRVGISSGYAALDDAAVTCASRWEYRPALKDGKPIEVPWKAMVKWAFH